MKFSLCGLDHAPGVGLGVLGVKHFSVGICDGAPSTARSSVYEHQTFDRREDSYAELWCLCSLVEIVAARMR